jgi:hypothetical protein
VSGKTASGLSLAVLKKGNAGAQLARAKELPEVLDFVDLAAAAKALAQTREQKLYAEEWHLRGQRKAGELLAASPIGKGRKSVTLKDFAVDENDSARWQAVAAVQEDTFEAFLEFGRNGAEDITRAGLLRYNKHGLLTSSQSPEFYTPAEYIEAARLTLGAIDLDPASNPEANLIVKAKHFYGPEDDGLANEWHGRVFLNPPYGGFTGPFVLKLVEEYESGRVSAAVLLISAHTTDTAYFQPLWDHALCFTHHRLPWYSEGGERTTGATFGSVFVYLGDDREDFEVNFERFGAIVCRWERPQP